MDGNSLNIFTVAPLSPLSVLLSLVLCAALSTLLGWHFVRFGSTFSNRAQFARVLPAIALTTVLVISVVKASLALSLGLVGALSIVRFRTPIKEPEELAYLFLAIAIGLGLGAGQLLVTVSAITVILALLSLRALLRKGSNSSNLYLNVDLPSNPGSEGMLAELLKLLGQHVRTVDLRRFDVHKENLQATFYVHCATTEELLTVQRALQERFPRSSVTFVDQSALPVG